MNIWMDGDSCPKTIKQILFRAAMKRKVLLFVIANHMFDIPPSAYIKRVLVESGFDAADRYIVNHVKQYDLVITSDIILADLSIDKGATALTPRGILYSSHNIKQALTYRNLNESLRNNGLMSGNQNPLNSKDIQNFANYLDKTIAQWQR